MSAELPPRSRTTSAAEEANVDAFVRATVDFKTNVEIDALTPATAAATAAAAATTPVLLLAPGAVAAAAAFAGLPAFTDAVRGALERDVSDGKIFALTVGEGDAARRVLIGLVPTAASRHNCAARPDAITTLVSEALGDSKRATALDVYSAFAREHDLAVATAVAKASHSFTSKAGAWQRGYAKELPRVRVLLQVADAPLPAGTPAALRVVAQNVQLCARLVDAPTNLLDTTTYPQIAVALARRFAGVTATVLAGEALREAGYGGLYGVGKGAEFLPALVTLSYKPAGEGMANKDKIALVGKGMVYDTGGLAIKTPVSNMCSMKCDMGGSAAVLCGFLMAAELGVQQPLDCVLCIADNAVGPRAFRNDDILVLKSGRTVQVNNTDAEGRLILSDGVFHAARECGAEPATIIDMATLTGAQGIATGAYHAAVYTNCGAWESRVLAAGRRSGDLCFPILYAPEFHAKEFASKGSDGKNSVADRSNAQSSCAGWFIEANLPTTYKGKYVHVDLASPAFQADLGTGYGVALLASLLVPAFAAQA
jgi:probable aminopeptidase NPEPL1